MRVELVGEELRVYRRGEEMRRREEEEVAYRRKRQDELAMVCILYIYSLYINMIHIYRCLVISLPTIYIYDIPQYEYADFIILYT